MTVALRIKFQLEPRCNFAVEKMTLTQNLSAGSFDTKFISYYPTKKSLKREKTKYELSQLL